MKLTTEVAIPEIKPRWSIHDRFVSLGSCFAEEVSNQLARSLVKVDCNPLGTVYSPLAIATLIHRALDQRAYTEESFLQNKELWRHFEVHSNYASTDKSNAVEKANAGLQSLSKSLLTADHLIITLGSAWIYHHRATDQDVGHNHQLPLDNFTKRLATVDEVVSSLTAAIKRIQEANSKINTLLTVSPVRHLRDGLHENNLSKSTLLLVANRLTSEIENTQYFPSYELLIDELRDYRFCAEDLAHPSELATEHIWEKLKSAAFGKEDLDVIQEIESIRTGIEHRPRHPDTEAYRRFQRKLKERIRKIEQLELDVSKLQYGGGLGQSSLP